MSADRTEQDAPAPAAADGQDHRCGHVALVGRPNTGKSTLLNRLVGQKVSITSRKPQTTRNQILGIQSTPAYQLIYIDTPGVHRHASRAINRYMNRAAASVLDHADVIVFVVRSLQWTDEDELVAGRVRPLGKPVVLAVSQVDRVSPREQLLPFLAQVQEALPAAEVVPVSALKDINMAALEAAMVRRLPPGPPLFPPEQVTDRSERFLAAELVREKLTRILGEELPYRLAVAIEGFQVRDHTVHVDAVIWVERESQKGIVIGAGGRTLKKAGADARRDMEEMLGSRVFLRTRVKVRQNWSDDDRQLRRMGYDEA